MIGFDVLIALFSFVGRDDDKIKDPTLKGAAEFILFE